MLYSHTAYYLPLLSRNYNEQLLIPVHIILERQSCNNLVFQNLRLISLISFCVVVRKVQSAGLLR